MAGGWTALFDIAGLIYDAAADVGRWEPALQAMVRFFGARAGQINYVDDEIRDLAFSAHYGLEERLLPKYVELMSEDPRIPVSFNYPGKPLLFSRLLDRHQWEGSRFYRELFVPAGLNDSMAFWFRPEDGGFATCGLIRQAGAQPFGQDDETAFGELIPHVRRAIALHRRLITFGTEERAALAALDALPIGVAIVDGSGHALFANRALQEIAGRKDGFLLVGGRIAATDPTRTRALRGMAEAAAAGTRSPSPGWTATLPRTTSAPLYVLTAPMPRPAKGPFARPLAVVFVSDPDRPVETSREVLQRLFGLTPAEAGVLEALVRGATVQEAAESLGVAVETARSQLKAIFAKSGTSRQAELVARVLASPAWLRAGGSSAAP